jgi:MoxR-like ATPase
MLAEIRARIYNSRDQQWIFWLEGMAGTGKSTIARTTARELHGRGYLGADFFFLHCGRDVGRAELFVTTIVSQLLLRST